MWASNGHHHRHHLHHGHHGFHPLWIIGGIIFLLLITNGKIAWFILPIFFFIALPLLIKAVSMMSGWWREHEGEMRAEWDQHKHEWRHEWCGWKNQPRGWWNDQPEKRKGGYRPERAAHDGDGEKPKNRPTYVVGDDGELIQLHDDARKPKRGADDYDYV